MSRLGYSIQLLEKLAQNLAQFPFLNYPNPIKIYDPGPNLKPFKCVTPTQSNTNPSPNPIFTLNCLSLPHLHLTQPNHHLHTPNPTNLYNNIPSPSPIPKPNWSTSIQLLYTQAQVYKSNPTDSNNIQPNPNPKSNHLHPF